MLLPRYSLRTILLLAVAVAVLAVVAGEAVTGAVWARAITLAVGAVVLNWMVLASFYAFVAVFSRVASIDGNRARQAPHYPAPRASSESAPNAQEA